MDRDYNTTGVRARTLFKSDRIDPTTGQQVPGNQIGQWTYSTAIETFPGWVHSSHILGPDCRRADYRITKVNEPAGENGKHVQRRYYFSLFDGPDTGPGGHVNLWQVTDNGLPYTKDLYYGEATPWIVDHGGRRLFLSDQSFLCANANDSSCVLETSRYLRYAMEFQQCHQNVGDPPSCWKKNPQLHRERTVYHTDSDKFVQVTRSNYNGAGNWEVEKTDSDFSGAIISRGKWTDFDATDPAGGNTLVPLVNATSYFDFSTVGNILPGVSEPWILTPFSPGLSPGGDDHHVHDGVPIRR